MYCTDATAIHPLREWGCRGDGNVMEQQGATAGQQLSWLLDDLATRVSEIRHAVILSRDGLTVATSRGLSREDAEHMSALAAGVQSLARGAGDHFSLGDVRQTIIELERAFLFVTAAGYGSCLAVLCPVTADAGLIAYEMAVLVKQAGPHLVSQPRLTARKMPGG
jgi:predicted regulator of Ras-like GTPase activity (Roadblock/LC7/MglB family)